MKKCVFIYFYSYYIKDCYFQPSLLFAGEHTHSSFYSTVHGAYLSGQTAARRLLAPDDSPENTLDCPGTADLNTWIQGVQLG